MIKVTSTDSRGLGSKRQPSGHETPGPRSPQESPGHSSEPCHLRPLLAARYLSSNAGTVAAPPYGPMEGNRGDPQKACHTGLAGEPGTQVRQRHPPNCDVPRVPSEQKPFGHRRSGTSARTWIGSLLLCAFAGTSGRALAGCREPVDPASAQKPWRALQCQIEGN